MIPPPPGGRPPAEGASARVCTVVLNWDQPAMTLDCVRYLLAQDAPGGQAVVVVDNGSTPANAAALRAGLPAGCTHLSAGRNRGFAGGMNVGLRHALGAGFEFVWLMNNDAFPAPDCLGRLVAAMDADPTLAAVTPRLVFPDGSPQLVGGRVDWETAEVTPLNSGEVPYPTPADCYVTGTALLFRRTVLRQVGLLDLRFFAYWEETDLCARILRRGGWNLAEVPGAACVHLAGATAGGQEGAFTALLLTRNGWLYARKRAPAWRWPRIFLRVVAAGLMRAADQARWGNPGAAGGGLAGVWAILTNQSHRPRRLRPPAVVERVLLRHPYGVARLAWRAANWLAPAAARRPFPAN